MPLAPPSRSRFTESFFLAFGEISKTYNLDIHGQSFSRMEVSGVPYISLTPY